MNLLRLTALFFLLIPNAQAATQYEQVLELYTAMFDRAADAAGVDYWVNEMENNNWSIENVADSFSQQPEYLNTYSTDLDASGFINSIYINVLGREADSEGLDYWVGEIDSGKIRGPHAVLAIINGAKANTSEQGILDAKLFANKTAVSMYFAQELKSNDLVLAGQILESVTVDDASVTLVMVDYPVTFGIWGASQWNDGSTFQ